MAVARDYKTRRPRPGAFSGWLGLGAGLALGLAVAAIIYLKDHKIDAALDAPGMAPKTSKRHPHGIEPPEAVDAAANDDHGASYDFYERLPKFEMVLPEKEKDVRPDIKTAPETRAGTYVLQAGSYRNFADADRVRAQLALQGVESKVQTVSVDKDTWHRIRIGPISNLDQLNRMRGILRKADVDFILVRVGD